MAEMLFMVTAFLSDMGLLLPVQAFIAVMMSVAFVRWLMAT